MPLRLYPPDGARSPNWRIRGTHLGTRVDVSARTADKKLAAKVLAAERARIEREAFDRRRHSDAPAATFASAAVTYMEAGGERRFLEPILREIGTRSLAQIDQATVNALAAQLYPGATPATLNRQVFTPVAAVLRAGGAVLTLRRPKGARGQARTFWLREDKLFALLDAGDDLHPRFGVLLEFLAYTGARLSEALRLRWEDVELDRAYALLRRTKNSEPQAVHLPPHMVERLTYMPRLHLHTARPVATVFGFAKSGTIYNLLSQACAASGTAIPDGVAFHAFRHTWAAWMRRYGSLDTSGLVGTGRWRDRKAAAVYEHVEQSDAARRADLLPRRRRA